MTVESATLISDLNSSLPAATDPRSEGDDHIRLIKSAVKATFPNVNAAVTATDEQLNGVNPVFAGLVDVTEDLTVGTSAADTMTINATPAGKVASGRYTPTASSLTGGVTAVTPSVHHYIRVGDEVHVTGRASVTATDTVNGTFDIDLPIASNLGFAYDLSGSGASTLATFPTNMIGPVSVVANQTADKATIRLTGSASATQNFVYSFTYTIL